MKRVPLIGLALLVTVTSGCRPHTELPTLSPDPGLDAFARALERRLEQHAWDEILAVANPEHRRIQVAEHGMPEPQYVAELFGLHRVGNNIERGQAITWSDLERIQEVHLDSLTQEGSRYTLSGRVELVGGQVLDIAAWIIRREGELRLTGGLG